MRMRVGKLVVRVVRRRAMVVAHDLQTAVGDPAGGENTFGHALELVAAAP